MDAILVKKKEGGVSMKWDSEDLITSWDVAEMLGTSKAYVRSLEKQGRLFPARQLPTGRRLYRVADVEEFIKGIETKKG